MVLLWADTTGHFFKNMDVPTVNRDRYKTIVQLAPDVVYTLSSEGVITSLSPAFERITGWKIKEWLGKNFAGIMHAEDLPLALSNFKKSLRGREIAPYRLRILKNNGSYLVGEFKSAPDIIAGKTIGVIGIGRDITRQYYEEQDLMHFKNVVESSDSAVISRNLSDKILTWNKAAEKLFGYSAKEMVGKNFSMLVPPENKRELKKIAKLVQRRTFIEDYEAIRIKKNGERINIVAKVSPVISQEGKVIGTSIFDRDNTLAKREQFQERFLARATKVLSSSLNYMQTLKKLAKILVPDLADWSSVHIFDENGKLTQLAVAHTDPAKVKWALDLQKRMAHLTNKEEENRNLKSLRAGHSQFYPQITAEMLDKMVKNKELRKIVDLLDLKSAITVPLVSGKNVLGSMSFVTTSIGKTYDERDLAFFQEVGRRAGNAVDNARLYHEAQNEIRERKRIQEELRASKDQLSVILENVVDGITVFDNKANVVFVNPAVALASGYKSVKAMLKAPIKWRNNFEVVDESGRTLAIKELPGREAVYTGRSVQKTVKVLNKKKRKESWSVISARPIIDQEGKLRGAVSVTHDITGIKELEQKKDEFISIASHELKTPVTSIKGFVHLLQKDHNPEDKHYKFLSKVDKQLDNLVELIEDLLTLSRVQAGKLPYRMKKVNISKLTREVVEDIQTTAQNHKIEFKDGVKQLVTADRERISQVLINLITNAIKYSPEGKNIIVEVKKAGHDIRVGVKDFGIGIDSREQGKLFDRFYRVEDAAHRTFPGLGIGLYLSKQIVTRHNGKIWFESKKGRGSTFYFQIPATGGRKTN